MPLDIEKVKALAATHPELTVLEAADYIGCSGTTLVKTLKDHNLFWTRLTGVSRSDRQKLRRGQATISQISINRTQGKERITRAWLSRPIRSYRHTPITYKNGVPA